MEYLNAGNIVTAIVVLLMISCVVKLFTGDIGSGAADEFITNVFGVVK
jgi:hypothetical protein